MQGLAARGISLFREKSNVAAVVSLHILKTDFASCVKTQMKTSSCMPPVQQPDTAKYNVSVISMNCDTVIDWYVTTSFT